MLAVEIRGLGLEKTGTQPYIILRKGLPLRVISTFIDESRVKNLRLSFSFPQNVGNSLDSTCVIDIKKDSIIPFVTSFYIMTQKSIRCEDFFAP